MNQAWSWGKPSHLAAHASARFNRLRSSRKGSGGGRIYGRAQLNAVPSLPNQLSFPPSRWDATAPNAPRGAHTIASPPHEPRSSPHRPIYIPRCHARQPALTLTPFWRRSLWLQIRSIEFQALWRALHPSFEGCAAGTPGIELLSQFPHLPPCNLHNVQGKAVKFRLERGYVQPDVIEMVWSPSSEAVVCIHSMLHQENS
jgi:hypothetical protein